MPFLPDVEESIWRSTQGNPLFVEEVLRLLAADASLVEGGALPIPHGVREVIRQRLGLLDEAASRLLDVAAVIGVEFDVLALSATAHASGADTASALARAESVGVLVPAGDGRRRFGHALMREAIYNDIPATRRSELHAEVSDVLERPGTSEPPLTEVAHHALSAGPRDPDRLIDRTIRAARAMVSSYALEDAVRLLERADSVLSTLPEESPRHAELWLALGDARMRAGDARGGAASCLRVAARAKAMNDAPLLARAALAYGSEFTMGLTDPTLKSLLEEALTRLAPEHRALRARLEGRLAASLQPAPDVDGVAAMATRAIADARDLGDDETLLEVLHTASAALTDAVLVPGIRGNQLDAVRLATKLGRSSQAPSCVYPPHFSPRRARRRWRPPKRTSTRTKRWRARPGSLGTSGPSRFFARCVRLLEGRFRRRRRAGQRRAREIIATVADPGLPSLVDVADSLHRLQSARSAQPSSIALEPELLARCAPDGTRERNTLTSFAGVACARWPARPRRRARSSPAMIPLELGDGTNPRVGRMMALTAGSNAAIEDQAAEPVRAASPVGVASG